jgi:hypothetical protein
VVTLDTGKMMKVKSACGGEERVTVLTTGAKYVIDSSGESTYIECWQMLNKERLNCTLRLSIKVKYLYIVENNEDECIIAGFPIRENLFRIQINKDSAMEIMSMVGFSMQASGSFLPDFFTEKEGISGTRFIAVGCGEFDPVASNNTPEGRQKNRRVSIIILSNNR